MLATGADALGDVGATSATVLSMVLYGVWGFNIDGIVGLIVSVFVMIAGINIARDTLEPLIGQAIDPEVYKKITDFVESYEGIIGTHDLIVHNYGPSRSMASIHAEVPSEERVEVSHEIIDRIERDCMRSLGIFLVIHMDPVETQNEAVQQYKELLTEVLKELDSRLSFHDFRMVDGEKQINLIFDLVVPREYNDGMRDTIKQKVSDEVGRRDERCKCVITVENSFCAENPESN